MVGSCSQQGLVLTLRSIVIMPRSFTPLSFALFEAQTTPSFFLFRRVEERQGVAPATGSATPQQG